MENVKLQDRYQLFIDGQWVDASDGATFKSTNPATGEFLAEVAEASKEDVDKAVDASWRAFPAWKKTTEQERAKMLNRIADIIDENRDFLATVETMDNGKPIRETSLVDVPWAAEHFRYFAAAILAEEDVANVIEEKYLSLILREPIGVVGQVIPWNFPFLMAAWKLAPALAAGNCVILKPSSSTSLSVLELLRLIADVLPAGVLNIITGAGSKSGQFILDHPGISKLAFTGSTEVGRDVALAAAKRLIPSTLELGGKSANIFFSDCNLEQALDGAQVGILFNQGQVCSAGSRIFVQEDFYDEFVSELQKRFEKVQVGNPLDMETQMGSQVNQKQLEKILSYIEIAKGEGARILTGGVRKDEGDLANGAFMAPTLIVDVDNKMRVAQEEIFGPVAVVIKFKDEEDVIRMANDSVYGLGGGVFTSNLTRAIRVSRAIETGRIWVNTYNMFPAGSPFGGVKESGIGRETHKMILDAYTQAKAILINLSDDPSGFFTQK